ncbi:adenylyl-sulfate kinase [Paraferrimonas sp. SM1919]|uniref:adenylyl-sulfate kinase n=1 Tax=Paraferrimonas sp. SM1919 TaxID=2662263 RepID=UPI0013D21711|nr:adenylyl-sulfate kinase [Paraferrimonas sp. SM1919]
MSNIVWHQHTVNEQQRAQIKQQSSVLLWFTGLSGSGKSTLANALEQALIARQKHTYLLDGDNLRHGLCAGLGFSEQDRDENLRRAQEVSKLLLDAGLIVLATFISPKHHQRQQVRKALPQGQFIEIYVSTSLEVCEQRDPKGLYKKARKGEIATFTGISDEYQVPLNPELTIDTAQGDIASQVESIIDYLQAIGVMQAQNQTDDISLRLGVS